MMSSRTLLGVRSMVTTKRALNPKAVLNSYSSFRGRIQTAAYSINHFYGPVKTAPRAIPPSQNPQISLEDIPRTKELLYKAVNSASPARLRTTILELCHSHPEFAHVLLDPLLGTPPTQIQKCDDDDENEHDEDDEEEDDENEDGDESDTGAVSARPYDTDKWRPGLQRSRCFHCEEEFDPHDNGDDAGCVHHDGHLEFSELAIADHDERRHGPLDTEQNRIDFPEKLVWTCCKGDVQSEGCQAGKHEEF